MPIVYSYAFTSEGEGPWWGIRCSSQFYQTTVRQMEDMSRCFVYMTNVQGNTLAIAIEGPYPDEGIIDDTVFVPSWVLKRLDLVEGDEVTMEAILEPLPKGASVTIRPMTGSSVEGPIFLEGLTEALNQLGVIQEGLLTAIVDPSMPELHEFMIEDLSPLQVCLADGDLTVNLERGLDQPVAPEPVAPEPEPQEIASPEYMASMLPPTIARPATVYKGFIPFSGKGNSLI